MSVGQTELLLIFLVPVLLGLVTTVDASSRPNEAFTRAGTNKNLWLVLPVVGVAFCGVVTIVAAIVWFTTVRPRVVAAAQAA